MPTTKKQLEFDRQLDLTAIREYKHTGNKKIIDEQYQKYALLVYGVCLNRLKKREQAKKMLVQIYKAVQLEVVDAGVIHFREWLFQLAVRQCVEFEKSEQTEK